MAYPMKFELVLEDAIGKLRWSSENVGVQIHENHEPGGLYQWDITITGHKPLRMEELGRHVIEALEGEVQCSA